MTHLGFSHVGLATTDMDATLAFYEGQLGFRIVRADIIKVKEGGEIDHVFLDAGGGQLIAFMGARDVERIPADFDAGLNRGLGLPDGMIHFAFEAGSGEKLEERRAELIEKGIRVSKVVDHEWCKSIYFKDPNGITLEYCTMTRELGEDDARMQVRAETSTKRRPESMQLRDE